MKTFQQQSSLPKTIILVCTCLAILTNCAGPSTPRVLQITAQSQSTSESVEIIQITATPIPITTPTDSAPLVSQGAEPIIFIGMGTIINQKCGHGDIVAADGHTLRATPRLLSDNSNFLEKLPQGTRVDIIDCRIWVDKEGVSWLAVRTPEKKLGWMHIQPDKFYVTLYPITIPPSSTTGIPAGSTVAYVPPSECRKGPVSNQAIATSIGIDLIPVVGDIKGLGEAATGCDMVTGESLGNWRWLGLLGLIGLSEIALLRYSDEAVNAARFADNIGGSLSYSDEAILLAAKNADTASDFLRALDQMENAADIGSDALRNFDQGAKFSDEALAALAKLEQPCSFSANTPVLTLSGRVPISRIRPGDWVLAYNESSKSMSFFVVSATNAHIEASILTLMIGNELIVTTPEHPFYVQGKWVTAGDLRVGDLITSANGTVGQVYRAQTFYESQTMYNLTIDTAHTYFVGAGYWLVHNACSRVLRNNLLGAKAVPDWANEIEWQAHHLIPGEFQNHPFVLRAVKGGWNIDGTRNGIPLPKADADAKLLNLPAHRGSHSSYSANVSRELDQLEEAALREGWDNARAVVELEKLIERLKRDLLNLTGSRLPL